MTNASANIGPVCCGAASTETGSGVWWRIGIGAFLAVNSMTIALAVNLSVVDREQRLVLQAIPLMAAVVVAILLGGPLLAGVWREWRARRLTIETLFLLGITGALGASLVSFITGKGPVFFEVVSILFVVYALGRELGRYSQSKVLEALAAWDASSPSCELLEATGEFRCVPITDVYSGSLIRAHPGAVIPVDGVVRQGEAFVREAGMTGESFAVPRRAGDRVLAGTHVVDATLIVEASVPAGERCVDRIAAAIREAALRPGTAQRTANRLMQWFVPFVAITAACTFAAYDWRVGWTPALFHAMAVLLVACPCALGFATPVAAWTGMRRLNDLGLVVKSGLAMERLAGVTVAAFDKTGTLTLPEATPEVEPVESWRARRHLLEALIAAAEGPVSHPIAKALRPLATGSGFEVQAVRILPARGIEADVSTSDGARFQVRVVRAEDTSNVDECLDVFVDGERAATVVLHETQRPLLAETVAALDALGIRSILLTGDSAARAARLSLPGTHSRLTPEEKLALVRQCNSEHEHVLYIGDGLNDAAAMSASDVAIAIGDEPLTRETAGLEWPVPLLSALPEAILVSRGMLRLVRSNLRFALVYNIVGMAIAAAGLLHPVVAALLMTASSAIVTLRSLQFLEAGDGGANAEQAAETA